MYIYIYIYIHTYLHIPSNSICFPKQVLNVKKHWHNVAAYQFRIYSYHLASNAALDSSQNFNWDILLYITNSRHITTEHLPAGEYQLLKSND